MQSDLAEPIPHIDCDRSVTEGHAQVLKLIFKENEIASHALVQKNYADLLEHSLKEHFPFTNSMWEDLQRQVLKPHELASDQLKQTKQIELYSPILLNRDLAAISLLCLGDVNSNRIDRVTSLLVYDEDEMQVLGMEASIALCHWRIRKWPKSKWFSGEKMVKLLTAALENEKFEPWAASALYWMADQSDWCYLDEEDRVFLRDSLKRTVSAASLQEQDRELQLMARRSLSSSWHRELE